MAQMEVFLGLKMPTHFPSIHEPYLEPILPDDVSDGEESDEEKNAQQTGPAAKMSAGAAARYDRAATAAFSAATRVPSQPLGSQIMEAMDNMHYNEGGDLNSGFPAGLPLI